ncbi:hypothetical protein MCAG_03913 [Micromonospora sp. ATCC 39149]|uniref:aldehyde dehydrogenase family protein n=1 Tax=Micromonospora sp. (strain ATCC 39149 / NRRL 15099 / SCC 1413) TaxID=219305 RepID=UPI0001A50674|nr:aldehyde dehydrogenase family protein [Micromonospora sp. ATCC 39149]EEP73586.1 hypothetical protein MCAG_03913 [Micromonospora sp. ATCC 39149]
MQAQLALVLIPAAAVLAFSLHIPDIDGAVAPAMTATMRNIGEACTAANRFFVHRAVADEFAARLAERVGPLIMGPGTRPGWRSGRSPTVLGPGIWWSDRRVRRRGGRRGAGWAASAIVGGAGRPGMGVGARRQAAIMYRRRPIQRLHPVRPTPTLQGRIL